MSRGEKPLDNRAVVPGIMAFGSYVFAAFVHPSFTAEGAVIGMAVSVIAGYTKSEADDFFFGLALQLTGQLHCW
jgi:hypothetical protein